ncbi:MAG: 50S ribosomal protein L24 [Anaerolineaceae bacterium]|nr:50S ribosomal protein L24 [Anaerolineaceae bacterium]
MKVKIRKGDLVEIISGELEDVGKRGEVIKVDPEANRVVVQGVNMRTKHQRQVQAQGRTIKPGLLKFEAPMALPNVMKVCPKCNKPTRIAIQRENDSVQRVCKRCKALMDE